MLKTKFNSGDLVILKKKIVLLPYPENVISVGGFGDAQKIIKIVKQNTSISYYGQVIKNYGKHKEIQAGSTCLVKGYENVPFLRFEYDWSSHHNKDTTAIKNNVVIANGRAYRDIKTTRLIVIIDGQLVAIHSQALCESPEDHGRRIEEVTVNFNCSATFKNISKEELDIAIKKKSSVLKKRFTNYSIISESK